MTLVEAVVRAGPLPGAEASQAGKKRYSEVLSSHLAQEVAEGLRRVGFKNFTLLRDVYNRRNPNAPIGELEEGLGEEG